MKNYSNVAPDKSRIDRMQVNFKCCGSQSFSDWWKIQWCTTWIDPNEITVSVHISVVSNFPSELNCFCDSFCIILFVIFTALHGMQTRSCDKNSVCLSVCLSIRPSVCLSVKRVHCDKTEEKSVQIFIPCERFCLVF